MATNTKKDKFYSVLKNIFIGAKIEGNSGYVNLMRIKNKYYKGFKGQLATDIDTKLDEVGRNFEEELYNKLYTFFKKYFSESGSIYFSYTPLQEKVYERIYRDDKDVMLFWKTNMLYYVKTERLFENMDFQDEDNQIWYHFDVSELEHKKSNEKKELIFEYDKSWHEDNKREIFLKVKYSKNGSKTKIEDILKKVKRSTRAFGSYKEKNLQRALGIFRKQSEVDYFINKNAKEFLREQFSLWIKTYVFDDDTIFEEARLKQLKALRDIAYNIIDLVSQFEDELVKIWNKPKFAHSSNYVITLDKFADKDSGLLEKLLKHKGIAGQIKEWQELGMCDDKFKIDDIFETDAFGKHLKNNWQYLPLDTKYFKDFELDILALFDDLDNQLDGWLIHSENYQALNTLKHKYRGKIKAIYTDPPFNLDSSDQFLYRTNYKDANWLTLLENRLKLAKDFLPNDGSFFIRCDYNGNSILRLLLDQILGPENYRNEIALRRAEGTKGDLNKQFKNMKSMTVNYDNLYWYSKNPDTRFEKIKKETNEKQSKSHWHSFWKSFDRKNMQYELLGVIPSYGQWMWEKKRAELAKNNYEKFLEIQKETNENLDKYWKRTGEKFEFIRRKDNSSGNGAIEYWIPPRKFILADTNWLDIKGYSNQWGFKTENSEVLLKRITQIITDRQNYILDFFLGSGTTTATAQKIGRKWIGIELGQHFETVILVRMKWVLFGKLNGVSSDNYKGGGFFKYYELEQYEETLRNAKYEDKGALPKDIYHQYLFFKDLKLADEVVKLDNDSKSIKVDLTKLHDKIDIPETLSFLTGKFIKQIFKDKVVFTDGSEIEYANIDYKIVKPLIWW